MEVFSGDHRLPTDVLLFPDTHVAPFALPAVDAVSDHHKTAADIHHPHGFNGDRRFLPSQPPQKLRPIRCGGRTLPECCSSNDPLNAKPLSWPAELGFYNAETDGGCFIPPNTSALGSSSKECKNEVVLSSSSGEDSKLQEAIDEHVNKKKRKRKSRKKLESFVENMMKSVIEKQEEMHRQLIELLEKKEQESITREEAWRQQEIKRAKRDEEARAKEISHSKALISFIQKSLGHEIQIPKPPNTSNPDKECGNHNEENLDFDMGNDQESIFSDPVGIYEDFAYDSIRNAKESECDSRRWPKSEVQALITVRAALNQKFNGKGPKSSVWEEVAAEMSNMGYDRTPKKCREKWENINKYYRRTMEKGKESAGKSKVCTYFTELETLYKNGFISGNSHDEDQSMSVSH